MPRGMRNGSDYEYAINQFTARIEERIVLFAAEIGVSANWVTERLATLLQPQRPGLLDNMRELRGAPSGVRGTLEPLALAGNARGGEAPPTIEAQSSTSQKRSNQKIKNWWASKTPAERSKIMRQRMKKWKPEAKARWAKNGAKKATASKPTKPTKSATKPKRKPLNEERMSKQAIYVQRSQLRQQGVPEDQLPPLPSKTAESAA